MDRDPSPETGTPARTPLRTHAMLIASLLTLTVAAGVAARITGSTPDPVPPVGAGDASARAGGVHLAAHLDRQSVLRGSDGSLRVELVMGAEERPEIAAARVPTDLVVVLDRSGSMQGQALHFAKAAVSELVSGLGCSDRFGLVTYATGGEVTIDLEAACGGSRERWSRTLDAIHASGGTDMSRGLDLGHALVARSRSAGRAPRVILLSDGHANQGDHSVEGLRARAARAVPGEYVLSAVGIGQGFDETVMSSVADAGTGNFYYLPDLSELAGVFADEFAAARARLARALEVRVDPGPGVRVVDVAGLPLTREGDAVRFRPGDLFAGQERRLWITLRAPTGSLGEVALGEVALAFSDEAGMRRSLRLGGLPQVACVAGEEDYYAAFDEEVYRRGSRSEGIGSLKQKVAGFIKAGQQAQAVAEVDAFAEKLEREQTRAFGVVLSEDAASLADLRDALSAPAAAAPAERNRLGKELLESGRDERRVGSKRKQK